MVRRLLPAAVLRAWPASRLPSSQPARHVQRPAFHCYHQHRSVFKYASNRTDSIFALASGKGKSGVAIIRVSGGQALHVLESLMDSSCARRIRPRELAVRRLIHPVSMEVLDRAMTVFLPGPKTFTGEDVAELHVHGGRAVVSAVLDSLASLPGLRPAEPGEFTQRAFENGKMDLTEVEGLADLLNADTESQRRLALHQTEGHTKRKYEHYRTLVIRALALVEANIDFGEDEQIEDGVLDDARDIVVPLLGEIQQQLNDSRRVGERLRDGIRIALYGPPNAGKSTMVNTIAQRSVAIVSPHAGTTRDVIDVALDLGGFPVILSDTAGIRDLEISSGGPAQASDCIEYEGITRAKERVETADIRVCVVDGLAFLESRTIDGDILASISNDTIVLLNKVDAIQESARSIMLDAFISYIQQHGRTPAQVMPVSCKMNHGIREFLKAVTDTMRERFAFDNHMESTIITQARHRQHLVEASSHMQRFLDNSKADVVIAAEDLRHAASSIGRITGHVDVEHVLDVIFRDFCIGK